MAADVQDLVERRCRAWGGNLDLTNAWQFYRDAQGAWRWRVVAAENGIIIGASSQGYASRVDCHSNAKRLGYAGPNPWNSEPNLPSGTPQPPSL